MCDIVLYQLPLILTAFLHVDLINVVTLTACILSGQHDVAFLNDVANGVEVTRK